MAVPPRPTSTTATQNDAGRNCPYCRFAFKQGVGLVRCPVCSASHHEDCWIDNGGCAVVGCSAAPDAAPGHATAGLAPWTAVGDQPPPPPQPSPPPSAAPGGAPSRLRGNALALGLIGLALTVAVIAGAIALVGRSEQPDASERAAATRSQTSSNPAPTGGSDGAAARSLASDREAIVAVLQRYAQAYTDHDVDRLRFVFTPDVTRHGLAAGGCQDASGRGSVLLQYRQQFDLGTGAYTLPGLSASAISVSGAHASADLAFSIAGGRGGNVSFELARFAGVWRVSRVDSHC